MKEATLSSDIDSDHSARIKKNLEKHGIKSTISKSPNPGYHEMEFTHPDRKHLVKHVKRYNSDIEDHNESVNEATLSSDIDSDHSARIKKNLEKHGIKSTISKSPNPGYHEMTFSHPDRKHLVKHVKRYNSDIEDHNESVNEAATKLVAKPQYDKARPAFGANVAADMDARKAEVRRKIAAKQSSMQMAKANKRISGSPMKEAKCSCGEEKGSKMACEVHGDNKGLKGGKEPIVMNPPLKEASNLPKAVVSKGHEIAKSLIKHRSKVKEPYAVGMAQAKKSANIKD
jgi:hypothetical protein